MQQLTGATHAAAWVRRSGEILRVREDIGRHNALDKLIGDLVRHQVSPDTGFFCITSRASFEMVQKAVVFGTGMLAAVSAPTALAVGIAKANNLALAGYVRAHNLVAYTFPERFHLGGSPITSSRGC
jgi:FdhD protein